MVTLSAASDWPVTLDFATADGTATAGSDYQAANGTLNFAPGDTAEPVTVLVNGDLVDESNETFFVNLSNPTNALIDDGLGVGTIIDDERNGSFSCRAAGLRVGGAESVVANPPDVPCRDDTKALGGVTLTSGLVSAQAVTLDVRTDQTPDDIAATTPALGDKGSAKATVQSVTLTVGVITIRAKGLIAEAKVRCASGFTELTPALSSAGSTGTVTMNGVAVDVSGHSHIGIAGVGTLHLNHTSKTATSITRRALWFESGLVPQVVAAEAKADLQGNPCTQ